MSQVAIEYENFMIIILLSGIAFSASDTLHKRKSRLVWNVLFGADSHEIQCLLFEEISRGDMD